MTIPLLDHLVSEMNIRFNEHSKNMTKILNLLSPSVFGMEANLSESDISEFLTMYGDDIPYRSALGTELHSWFFKWKSDKGTADDCNTVIKALKEADVDMFPNIHTLLRIVATQPVTSCECERSISKIRLVKSALRSSMTQEQLNGLTLLNVHAELQLDIDKIIDMFAKEHPRRMKLINMNESNQAAL